MSTPPSQPPALPGYRADPPSLRGDADAWRAAAQTLGEAAAAADGLQLDGRSFSYLANLTTGVDAVYAQLQTKLATLLHQGSTSFSDIADALDATAETYELAEQAALDGLPSLDEEPSPGGTGGTGRDGGTGGDLITPAPGAPTTAEPKTAEPTTAAGSGSGG